VAAISGGTVYRAGDGRLRDFRHIGRKSCFFRGFPLTPEDRSDRLTLSGRRAGRMPDERVSHILGAGE